MRKFARVAIKNHRNEFLLIHTLKGRNRWEFPGGKVNPGETPIEAAWRELYEETDIQAGVLTQVAVVRHITLDDEIWDGYFFTCQEFSRDPIVMEPKKASELKWFTIDGMTTIPTIPILSLEIARRMFRPKIVCLCGSTTFYREFQKANYQETGKGHIVLTVGFFMHSPEMVHGETLGVKSPEQKMMLDELHKRKIDLCDEVLVLDIGCYIGESTKSEVAYAEKLGKNIRYISEEGWTL